MYFRSYIFCLSGIILICLFSCNKDQGILKYKASIHLSSGMLKSEIKPFSDVVCANDSHSNYGWMNAKTGVLRLIDLNSGKLSKEIDLSKIDSSLYYKSNPTKIFIHNLDSIFILPQESKIIYLVDGNGDRINSWEIPFAGIQEDFVLSGFGNTPLEFRNGKLYIRMVPLVNPVLEKYRYYAIPPELVFQLSKDSIHISQSGGWPGIYKKVNYYNDYPARCLVPASAGDYSVWSFAADSNLWFFRDTLLEMKKKASSRFITSVPVFPDDSIGNIAYTMKHITTSAAYGKTGYDKWRKLIYRVAYQECEYETDDKSTIRGLQDKPWSLIILDKDLNQVDEIQFNPDAYTPDPLIITPEGWLINKRRKSPFKANEMVAYDFSLFMPDIK